MGSMRSWQFGIVFALSLSGQSLFEGESDIGEVARAGTVSGMYRVLASGANMWSTSDEFHFVWKKVAPGDLEITADISILTETGNAHRKGFLMIRQSLDADAAYVSATLHGDGMASLQSRPAQGATTYEVQSNIRHPKTLRLVKRGEFAYLWVGNSVKDLEFSGGSMRVNWKAPFYVGIGACAHDKEATVEVGFDNTQIQTLTGTSKETRFSTLETVPFPAGDRRAIYATAGMLRGPAYFRDGAEIVLNVDDVVKRVPVAGGKAPEPIVLGDVPKECASFQGFEPNGKRLAVSCGATLSVYVTAGGVAKRITHKIPTTWHGWSPDGQTLLYSIDRKGRHDIARIPAKGGGKEIRLTSDGMSDNPEFSADGQFIYFNSEKSGTMQVWRMPAMGGASVQITADDFNNWYPHVSPDGKRILVLSCDKAIKGPPVDREVQLRVFTLETKQFQVAARLLKGGRGSVDSPSWSPDGKRITFVSYQFLPQLP